MPTLPSEFLTVILPYARLFCKRVFVNVQLLLTGAILTPGKRTVSSVLRIMGQASTKAFHKYHRVLSQVEWSTLQASRILLTQLVGMFVGQGPVVVGIDETLERRWGKSIKAKGIYRDAVRSSEKYVVKCSGLRWVSVMILCRIEWAKRVWALPFLTALAPSQAYYAQKARTHKTLTDWARQLLLQVKRWLPDRQIVAVGDSSYAVIDLLLALQGQVSLISRLRLDAALYGPIPVRPPGQRGRNRLKGDRLPTLPMVGNDRTTVWQKLVVGDWYGGHSQAVEYCTSTALWYHGGKKPLAIRWVLVRLDGQLTGLVSNDASLSGEQMISYFVRRWSMETTFALVRSHLGVETQRQWSDRAIARTTPVLLGLFSVVSLVANRLEGKSLLESQISSWYEKKQPTFSDALACVRRYLWVEMNFSISGSEVVHVKMSQQQYQLWQEALAWAA
ncbi:IS701 family transposase [Spirosoma foliorum]|uniref:Transposase n=1 Tax=Spirosoma foliorum TaxID=2710596 RepID=A0A7G5GRG7_9BACT|nr:transposase [Spirosoma foliorum]QMW01459.1 transposase [Spirosoma foliorum]QMW06210.1 transposase [Spirosoma foliorum]